MKALGIGAVLLCAFVASAGAQAIAPDDGRVDEVIRAGCERDFPTDFRTRLYCISMQQDAAKTLRDGPTAGSQSPPIIIERPSGIFDQGPIKPGRIIVTGAQVFVDACRRLLTA